MCKLEDYVDDRSGFYYYVVQYYLEGLKYVLTILDNIYCGDSINPDDMKWVANDIFANPSFDVELIRKCNKDICSDEDCEALIEELKTVKH